MLFIIYNVVWINYKDFRIVYFICLSLKLIQLLFVSFIHRCRSVLIYFQLFLILLVVLLFNKIICNEHSVCLFYRLKVLRINCTFIILCFKNILILNIKLLSILSLVLHWNHLWFLSILRACIRKIWIV